MPEAPDPLDNVDLSHRSHLMDIALTEEKREIE